MLGQTLSSLSDWFARPDFSPGVAQALFVLGVVLTLASRSLLHNTRLRRRLDSALTLLALGLAAGAVSMLGPHDSGPFLYVYAFFVAAVAIGATRALLVLFVDFHLRERRGAAVSRIFSDVGSVLIYFLIILVVLRFTLDLNLTSLITTSAVLTAIVGLAFQDVLSSVISGIVIEVEDPFGPGDWVRIGAHEGKVLETGWRTTRIRTRVNEVITLPNIFLAREPVVNFSRPDPRFGETLRFDAAYEAPPDLVVQAAAAVLEAEQAILTVPAPEVRTEKYNASGVQYMLRYWIDDFDERERISSRVMASLWYSLRRFGVRIPFPARDVFVHSNAPAAAMETGDVRQAIARVGLCKELGEDRIKQLAAQAKRRLYGDGEAIVREGDDGESFFIVEHGDADVVVGHGPSSSTQAVATLHAGEYFGEMSLLAGEPRSATVVARGAVSVLEIGRQAFQEIVEADSDVLGPISEVAAQRAASQQQLRAEAQLTAGDAAADDAQRLLKRIRAWFRV